MFHLAVAALVSIATSSIYAYVGSQIMGRSVSSDARLASVLFGTWWYGLAAVGFISATLNLAAAGGYTDLNLWLTLGLFNLLVLCIALWALLYYLIFLYTGSRRALVPLSIFYGGLYLGLLYLINLNTATHVEVGRWSAQVKYDAEIRPEFGLAFLLLLVLPQLLAALAYLSLYSQATDRTQKYRIAMVSLAIIVWFGSSLVVGFAGLSRSDAWQVASRILALAATLTILIAYKPPAALKEKYGLRSIRDRPFGEDPVHAQTRAR